MNEKREMVRGSKWDWAVLVVAGLLLGVSVWVLTVDYVDSLGRMLNRPEMAVRQGLFGLLALALAFGIGRYVPTRMMLRYWWLPLPLFAVMLLAIPVTSWAGWGVLRAGTAWWHRSPGWIVSILFMISGLMYALPRLVRRPEPEAEASLRASSMSGVVAFAGILLFAAARPFVISHSFVLLFVLFGIAGLCAFVVLQGWRRWAGFFATIFTGSLVLRILAWTNPVFVTRLFSRHVNEYFQGYQAQAAIHAGGITGSRLHPPYVPEWNTDFIFSRLCNAGGMVMAGAVLLLAGMLLTLAWRIVAKQARAETRTLAAGCAALLTLRGLMHVAINTGVWPLMPMPAPFLSYGPVFMLFDGVLLGVLIALGRDAAQFQRVAAESPAGEKKGGRGCGGVLLPRWPVTVVHVGVWVLLALFVWRLWWLVLGDHRIRSQREDVLARMEARELERSKPDRGRILDVHGRVLAQPGLRHYVCADPYVLAESPDRHLHDELLRLIGVDGETFERRTSNTSRRYVRLAIVPDATAEAVRRMCIRGIFVRSYPSRDYPVDTPLVHIAGVVNYEMVGASGVEQSRHRQLESGQDVRLTIAADLQGAVQAIAEYHVRAELRTTGRGALKHSGGYEPAAVGSAGAEGGRRLVAPAVPGEKSAQARGVQIVVMNPRTGAIMAAAQIPATHGHNSPSADPRARMWRSNMDVVEPGGLVQPLVIASALAQGFIEADTLIDTENGAWEYHGTWLRDARAYAEMTPAEILIKAGNIGMAKIGLEMGEEALHDALVKWGLNTRAGECVPGSGVGILHSPSRWSKIEVTRIPIGHGLACTVMQLLRAYTPFFNDEGRMVEPYLIEEEKDQPAFEAPIGSEAIALVRGMLERVVSEGTGRRAAVEGITVFGKTAVVQKAVSGGYCPDTYHSAFIGGLEVGNSSYLIAVWLDEFDREKGVNPAPEIFARVAMELVARDNKED